MLLFVLGIIIGLGALVWSADVFVDSASDVSTYFGVPQILIGIVILGFGTSAPEMIVSALSAYQGNPGIALGNAYGSNIANIALVLGITAIVAPISVHPHILKKQLPLLSCVTVLAAALMFDLDLSRSDATILFMSFLISMYITQKHAVLEEEDEASESIESLGKSFFMLFLGLIVLLSSSKLLVWGAVSISKALGVSNVLIGLTAVAVGTSLPELAASISAAKKGKTDIALGNIIGSNLFNTLVVVGIAGSIAPTKISLSFFNRDIGLMLMLTFSLFIFGYGYKKKGKISRLNGAVLVMIYLSYTLYLIYTAR